MSDVQRAILRMLRIPPANLPPPDSIAGADLRTSMCDARAAVVLALGQRPDSMGYAIPEPVQLALFEEIAA